MSYNDYMMKPTFIESIGEVYPIKVKDYDTFKSIANSYLVNDLKNIYNLQRINFDLRKKNGEVGRFEKVKLKKYDSLFQYLVTTIQEIDNVRAMFLQRQRYYMEASQEDLENLMRENPNLIEEIKLLLSEDFKLPQNDIYTMFEMVLHKKVVLIGNVIKILDTDYEINENNFETFKEVVMQSNLLYKPLIGFDLMSHELIQKSLSVQNDKNEVALESILATVSIKRGLKDEELEEYTWYRLMYDFKLISREYYSGLLFMSKTLGGDVNIPDLSEKVEVYCNPYKDVLKKHNPNSGLDKKLN